MKILIIMDGFFPGEQYGGPPVSVKNCCDLMQEHEFFIITKNHDLGSSSPYTTVPTNEWVKIDNRHILYLSDKDYKKEKFDQEIQNIKPDLLYLQGLFQSSILPSLFLAKKYNIRVLLAPRGELCAGAFRKKYKKVPYILFIKTMRLLKGVHFQATSEEESFAVKKILGAKDEFVHSLPNIPTFPSKKCARPLKKRGTAHIVFLSRIVSKKNLLFALEVLGHVKGCVFFDIYGPKENLDYWNECERFIGRLPENIHVRYLKSLKHSEVNPVLSQYDLMLFPTRSENYGHVIVESLLAGTPVVISDQTPWNDVAEFSAGYAYSLDSMDKFVAAVNLIVNNDDEQQKIISKSATAYIQKKQGLEHLKSSYERALNQVVNV